MLKTNRFMQYWNVKQIFLFFFILSLLTIMPSVAKAAIYDPGPADSITRLVPYLHYDNGDPNRIPLILIHGIHGTEDYNENGILDESEAGQFSGWDNFLSKYNESPDLQSKYKIYRFLYLSDKQSVWEIARSLRNHIDDAIDAGELKDGEFVILAHSMGGLVARSYMNEHSHRTGIYGGINHTDGQRGGERVLKLITLATPHHGTPLANDQPRVNGVTDPIWDTEIKIVDRAYWCRGGDTLAKILPCLTSVDNLVGDLIVNEYESNRSDLKYDNFDGRWNTISDYTNNYSTEKNNWLIDLPSTYDSKIIAYWGYIASDDVSDLGNMGADSLRDELGTRKSNENEHGALRALGVFLERIWKPDFSNNIAYLNNDGMVPWESAYFDNHTVAKQVACPNHDHLDMLDGKTTTCNNGLALLDSVVSDLSDIWQTVSAPFAPTGVSATAGDGQATISWSVVSGATSYNIYWATTSGVTKTNGTKITGSTSLYTHTGRTNGITYYYVVTAVNSYGESGESSQVSATPWDSTAGLVGYWKMDETSGSTVAADSSGNNNNGTLLGVPTFVTGKSGNAISFDGVNDYISMPSVISGPGWTINVWIKLNTATDAARVYRFGVQSGCNPSSVWFAVYQLNMPFGVGCANSIQLNPAINLQLGTWYMVTAVWDTNNLASLYLNGQLVAGPSNIIGGQSISYGGNQEVGADWSGGTHYFSPSQIDELRIYNRVLSASEISTLASPQITAPSAPTGVSATAGNGQTIVIWNAVSGATSYNIYYSTTSGVTKTTGTKIANVTSPYTHTGLTNGTTYYYVVTAVNTYGESSESSQVSAIPQSATSSNKIVFSSNRDGNYEIYVMNTDGTNQTRLTNNTANDYEPSWSPDGNKIAFVSERDGNAEIYVMNADGTNQTRLTNNSTADSQPAWSPDGTKIVFASERDTTNTGELYTMNADGTNQQSLTNNSTYDAEPTWSPDGTKIAFASYQYGTYEIFTMNSDGTNQQRLTNSSVNERGPAWSPDGTKIVFKADDGSWNGTTDEIYIINADGTNRQRLTNNSAEDNVPTWSPDGTKIVFDSKRDGNYEIYVMNSDGSNQTRLTNNSSDDRHPSLSTSSGVLSYTLTITKSGTGSGTVTSSPSGITCGADCSEIYTSGTIVTLSPAPDSGYTFTNWSGDADCTDGVVTMDSDKTCTANFAATPNISASVSSLNFGSVTINTQSPTKTITFTNTGTADLTASNVEITGTDSGMFTLNGGTCQTGVPLASNSNCILIFTFRPLSAGAKAATFTVYSDAVNDPDIDIPLSGTGAPQYTLNVNNNPSEGGTVTGTDISCPEDCTGTYNPDTALTLTATANNGYTFGSWTGCDSVSGNTCDITMNSEKTITATFISSALYVVWSDNTYGNNEIFLKKSTDNGATWAFQRLTTNTGNSQAPVVAVNGNEVYVAWQDDTYGPAGVPEIFLKKSTDGGNTWVFQRLTTNTGNSQVPAIAVNGNEVYIVWQDDTYGPAGVSEIFLKKSIDGGNTWTFQRLTTNTGVSMNPSIVVNGNNVYAVWQDDTYGPSGVPEIFMKRSTDSGATWQFQRMTTNAGYSGRPSMAVDGSNIYVVWPDDTYGNYEIFFKKSTDGGNTWAFQRLTTNAGTSGRPSIALSSGNLYVVWEDDTYGPSGVPEIFMKKSINGGNTWVFQRLTTNTGASVNPSLRVNGTDVYAVWQDDTYGSTGVPEIFLKRSTDSGATWQFQRLTTNIGNSVMPAIMR